MTDLVSIASMLFQKRKGILAADESVKTADKRLTQFHIKPGEDMRLKDRELFLNAPGIEEYLSGVILHEETFGQKGLDRMLFTNSLAGRGIAPGIKVDGGTEPMPDSPDEVITSGLIGLPERLADFKKRGAVFTKWRAVIKINGDRLPTNQCIMENGKRLASYAKAAQEAGLIPMVEPEVLLEGTHSRMRCFEVLKETLTGVFAMLEEQAVDPSGVILKTAMVLSGNKSGKEDTPEEVAEGTLEALIATVPKNLAGVVFLSGGQTPSQATENLAAIVKRARQASAPWPMTFSFARALQEEALIVWEGKDEDFEAAQRAYLKRLAKVSDAVASA